ncbi:hypothetical protein BC938DRAFT_480305 [Jimgerdemannia flammicorona]|uniref:NmrA-like domain-containing protein n=1 Tax=Jimgerdemannia flammicorona TaxID=994334 RepID=A0A433QJ18_9FUNG|nr:hypothetical protein BC938DRAFT_480305 [Jimgerdemannia flammicorona]
MTTLLLVGATGFLGIELLKTFASVPHKKIIALVRPETLSADAPLAKQARVLLIRDLGVEIRTGSLEDKSSLVEALRGIDVVISAVGQRDTLAQVNLVQVIAEVGTVKRFVPSDFGYDSRLDPEGTVYSAMKLQINDSLVALSIPHTIISTCAFMTWLNGLGEPGRPHPNADRTANVYGNGQTKALLNDVTDVARYCARIVFDPRTLNRRVMCDGHEATVEEVVAKWEWITEKEMLRKHVSAKEVEKRLVRAAWIRGDFRRTEDYLSASELYPDIAARSVSVERYLEEMHARLERERR